MLNPPLKRSFSPSWANRILIAATVGILILTLFPFRIDIHRRVPVRRSHFLLGRGAKFPTFDDAFLNILLFVPFGFGLAEKMREKGKSRGATLLIVFASGALFSYTIEFLQLFIPTRDSGWEDVITNSSGGVVGALLFEAVAGPVIDSLTATESVLRRWLIPSRAVPILLIYFCAWIAISGHFQKRSDLSNWLSGTNLTVENSQSGDAPIASNGRISQLQFWNRALPASVFSGAPAQTTSIQEMSPDARSSLLGLYELSGGPPFKDQLGRLPELRPPPDPSEQESSQAQSPRKSAFVVSANPVSALVENVQKTGQFSVGLIYTPAAVSRSNSRIISIANSVGQVNLSLSQFGSNLIFWFRTPITAIRSYLSVRTGRILQPDQPVKLFFSYDGSNLNAYVDGEDAAPTYVLGPGTVVAGRFYRLNPIDLGAIQLLYYAGIFLPAGLLIGLGLPGPAAKMTERSAVFFFLTAAAAILLEAVLVHTSHRAFSAANIMISVAFAFASALWIHVDRWSNLPRQADSCG